MFDGMHHQDQLFHQFISSSSSSPPPSSTFRPPPPPTDLHQHHHNHLQQISSRFPNFDNSSFSTPSPPPPNHQSIQFHDLFHRPNLPLSFQHLNQAPPLPQAHHLTTSKQYNDHQHSHKTILTDEVHHQKDFGLMRSLLPAPCTTIPNINVERELFFSSSSSLPHHHQSLHQSDDIWSNEEVVALLRIRSSSDSSWFPPEITWEHVSRKLAEIGFKKSAEKCKEKFEEESRTYFNTSFNINNFNNNGSGNNKINNETNNAYKLLSDIEDFCTGNDNIDTNIAEATDDHAEDLINDSDDHQGMEVDEKHKVYDNVCEGIREADRVTNEDASYPSQPDHQSQPEKHQEALEQSDLFAAVDGKGQQMKAKANKRIRKQNKEHKFKVMKRLCQGFVNKMMNQQEELHNKTLKDLFKRDEENVAREEAWQRIEMERLNSEIEMREQEQAIAGDRQAAIIEFLHKFSTTTSASSSSHQNQKKCFIDENIVTDLWKVLPIPNSHISKIMQTTSVENDQVLERSQNPSDQTYPCPTSKNLMHEALEPQTPTSAIQPKVTINQQSPTSTPLRSTTTTGNTTSSSTALVEFYPKPSSLKGLDQVQNPSSSKNSNISARLEDYGKRWPRDEVLALINIRCSFMANNSNIGDQDNSSIDINGSKAPLWEKISQKMSELGYKRSAKRCKEKWENINKYFRKTKDNGNTKRSLDSRTCPYFHQLSHLYNQGTLVAPTNETENQLPGPETHVPNAVDDATTGGEDGDKKNMQE